jgi:hypothetical protein
MNDVAAKVASLSGTSAVGRSKPGNGLKQSIKYRRDRLHRFPLSGLSATPVKFEMPSTQKLQILHAVFGAFDLYILLVGLI